MDSSLLKVEQHLYKYMHICMYICDVGDGNHDGQRKDSIRG